MWSIDSSSSAEQTLRNYIGRHITCTGRIPSSAFYSPLATTSSCSVAKNIPIPLQFEWKRELMVPIRDQGMCTSCWAFTVSDMLADRLNIYTNGEFPHNLSVQYLLSCFSNHAGCSVGGSPEDVYGYIAEHGLPHDSVYPYEQHSRLVISKCKTELLPPKSERVFVRESSIRSLCAPHFIVGDATHRDNIRNMQIEILLNGPITGTLAVYDDIYRYAGPPVVYKVASTAYHGGHSCEVLGWDCRDKENAYWIVRTSWGKDWPAIGMGSIVYVRFGVNEGGIEARASCAIPELPSHLVHHLREHADPHFYTMSVAGSEAEADAERSSTSMRSFSNQH